MHPPTNPRVGAARTSHPPNRRVVASLGALALLMSFSLVASPLASAAGDGPHNFPNSAIADRAEGYANGAYGGQCLVFATNMIKAAGGPQFYFGYDTSTYQAQWAQRATSVGTLAETQRGDIVQWGGGAGGNPHTAIITSGGSSPQVIDSNWGWNETVSRGSLTSHSPTGSAYRIWRVGRAALPPPSRKPDFTGDGKADLMYMDPNSTVMRLLISTGSGFNGSVFASGMGQPQWEDAGDFNGDGKSDLIYQDPSSPNIRVLTSGGGQASGNSVWAGGMGMSAWRVAG